MNPHELLSIIRRDTGLDIWSHHPLLDGWDNIVLEINDELICRFTRREDILKQHIKELELLPLLNKHLTIQVPNPIYHQTEESPYYMAYRKILDKPITNSFNKESLTKTITRFLQELQRIDHTGLRKSPRYTPETWRKEYHELHQRIITDIYPSIKPQIRDEINREFKAFNETSLAFEPTLCHRDLTTDHILELDGVITGIIDWGDACIGDPAFDLTGLLMEYGEEIAETISDELGYPPEYLSRARFYAKVAPFYETLYGLELEDDVHTRIGLEKINKAFS